MNGIGIDLGADARRSLFGRLAEEEEAYQLARHRTFAQAGVGFADEPQLLLVGLAEAVAQDVNNLKRGRIVAVRGGENLLGRLPEYEFFERAERVDQPGRAAEAMRTDVPALGLKDFAGHVIKCLIRDGVVDEPLPRGLPTVERTPREQHRDGFHETDGPRQPHRSTPAGDDAEFHLRQPELRLAPVVGDAIATGQGELEPAAEARAGNQRHGRDRKRGEVVKDLLPRFDEIARLIRRLELLELGDIRTGNEVA